MIWLFYIANSAQSESKQVFDPSILSVFPPCIVFSNNTPESDIETPFLLSILKVYVRIRCIIIIYHYYYVDKYFFWQLPRPKHIRAGNTAHTHTHACSP